MAYFFNSHLDHGYHLGMWCLISVVKADHRSHRRYWVLFNIFWSSNTACLSNVSHDVIYSAYDEPVLAQRIEQEN
jgi:hypothetical protein